VASNTNGQQSIVFRQSIKSIGNNKYTGNFYRLPAAEYFESSKPGRVSCLAKKMKLAQWLNTLTLLPFRLHIIFH
jgi:hypothetical protein